MRRRLLLVPFTVQIPPAERDPRLAERLRAEWPAILRWCIEGCLEWQRIGLAPPAIVHDATEEYFAAQDTLQQWLEDCTEDGGQFAFSRIAELFASWKTWAEDKPEAGSAGLVRESRGPRLRKSPQQHRSPRVPQPCRKNAMTAGLTASDTLSDLHRYACARVRWIVHSPVRGCQGALGLACRGMPPPRRQAPGSRPNHRASRPPATETGFHGQAV